MGNGLLYTIQIIAYSALLFSVYLLVLKNRASHNWNRLYLLLCAALPLAIPFISIPAIHSAIPINPKVANILLPQVSVYSGPHNTSASSVNWSAMIPAIYAMVCIALFAWTVIQFIRFARFVRANKSEVVNNIKVLLNTNAGPGSFHNYIFLPGDTIDPVIFEHELAHIKLKHSQDIIFVRLLRILFWPNVMLYFILRELKVVHEFQADAYAAKNKESYISTLLNSAFCTNQFALSHTFFYHPLKRRIMMLQQSPLTRRKLRMAIMKTCILAMLLITGAVYLQSCKQADNIIDDHTIFIFRSSADSSKGNVILERTNRPKPPVYNAITFEKWPPKVASGFNPVSKPSQKNDDTHSISYFLYALYYDTSVTNGKKIVTEHKLYNSVRSLDYKPKPNVELGKFLEANLNFPESARQRNIGGMVVVQFIVDDNGRVIEPCIVESPDSVLSEEALRVIRKMPDWTPGKQDGEKVSVYYVMPIMFVNEAKTSIPLDKRMRANEAKTFLTLDKNGQVGLNTQIDSATWNTSPHMVKSSITIIGPPWPSTATMEVINSHGQPIYAETGPIR